MRLWPCSLTSIVLLAASSAHAEPDLALARTWLDRAHHDLAARHYEDASHDYEQALLETPQDARVLSDYSFVAMRAGDPASAVDGALRSIAATRDARLMAASFYNLGRALEMQHEPDGIAFTIQAYAASRVLRPESDDVSAALSRTTHALAAVISEPHDADAVQLELDASRCARSLAGAEPWIGDEAGLAGGLVHCAPVAPGRGAVPRPFALVSIEWFTGVMNSETHYYLVKGSGASWSAIAHLGSESTDSRPGGAEISGYSSFKIASAAVRARVLTLELVSIHGTVGGENDFAGDGKPHESTKKTSFRYPLP
jgi:hypothetical protein